MSSRCRFSTHWASIASASVSLTTRTGSFSSSASFAALRRRAPATTSYLLSSSSRTRRGASIPCVLKLAASSSRLLASKRLRGLVADSASAVMGTLRYSWLLTALCVLGMIFLLSLFVGHVSVDSAHTSGLKAKRCRYWRFMRLPRVPLARGQCPRGSRQRFVERLPSSRAEDWRLHAKAGCSQRYVGPNIRRIMLPSYLCDAQRLRWIDRGLQTPRT